MTYAIIIGTLEVAVAPKAPAGDTVRFTKRGPRAWENFMSAPLRPLRDGGTTRLLVHAVADASSMQWIPKVREFLLAAKRAGADLSLPDGLDTYLAQYMDWLCYGEQRSPSIGTLLLFGIVCLLPEVKGKLPLAARSLKSWSRLATSVEGGPIPEEIIFLIVCDMIAEGLVYQGCWVLCQYDAYGREQDMEQLWGADISWDGHTMALVFGEAARGASAKTGHNQGVIVQRAEVVDIFLALKELAGEHKVFPITQEALRQSWHRALRRRGLSFAGPPHSIRHSGPSEDLARGRAQLEDVRRRGRWKAMESVQRYTKSFALTRFRARTPDDTRTAADNIASDLRRALVRALSTAANAGSPVAAACLRTLRQKRGRDTNADKERGLAARRESSARERRAGHRRRPAAAYPEPVTDESDDIGWATD